MREFSMTLNDILLKHQKELNNLVLAQEKRYHELYSKIVKFITDSNAAKMFPDRLNVDASAELMQLRDDLKLPKIEHRKKIGAQYCVYEDSGTLTESIQRIYPYVDAIQILLNYRPWCGEPNPAGAKATYDTVRSIPDPEKKIMLISKYWETEAEQRNYGKDLFEKMGMPWTMIIDDDEMYNGQELADAIETLQKTDHQALLVHQQIYWKTKDYCMQNITYAMPTFVISNLERCHFHYCRNIKVVGTWTNLDPNTIINHHLSYVRTDDKLLRKIQTFSHADEERRDGKNQKQIWQDWYENVWLKWEPEMTGLHPNPSEKYSWYKAIDAKTARFQLEPLKES